jgi:hypothetical protein
MEDICRVEGLQRAEGLEMWEQISGKWSGSDMGVTWYIKYWQWSSESS